MTRGFTVREYNEYRAAHPELDLPSVKVICRLYGSWTNAQVAEGYIPTQIMQATKDDVRLAFSKAGELLGKCFTVKQYNELRKAQPDLGLPSMRVINRLYGSWTQAKKEEGFALTKSYDDLKVWVEVFERYASLHHHCNPPKGDRFEGRNMAEKAQGLKRQFRNGTLPSWAAERLEAIGFVFEQQAKITSSDCDRAVKAFVSDLGNKRPTQARYRAWNAKQNPRRPDLGTIDRVVGFPETCAKYGAVAVRHWTREDVDKALKAFGKTGVKPSLENYDKFSAANPGKYPSNSVITKDRTWVQALKDNGIELRPMPKHGTAARFRKGCECGRCVKAQRAYTKATYERRKEKNRKYRQTPEVKERRRKIARERYANDPEYRKKAKLNARAYHKRKKARVA